MANETYKYQNGIQLNKIIGAQLIPLDSDPTSSATTISNNATVDTLGYYTGEWYHKHTAGSGTDKWENFTQEIATFQKVWDNSATAGVSEFRTDDYNGEEQIFRMDSYDGASAYKVFEFGANGDPSHFFKMYAPEGGSEYLHFKSSESTFYNPIESKADSTYLLMCNTAEDVVYFQVDGANLLLTLPINTDMDAVTAKGKFAYDDDDDKLRYADGSAIHTLAVESDNHVKTAGANITSTGATIVNTTESTIANGSSKVFTYELIIVDSVDPKSIYSSKVDIVLGIAVDGATYEIDYGTPYSLRQSASFDLTPVVSAIFNTTSDKIEISIAAADYSAGTYNTFVNKLTVK